MDSTSQTAADDTLDIVGVNRGKETIKKLVVELKEKIKELEGNKQNIQKLLIGYDREKTLANQANAVKLEMANKMKEAFETTLWNFIDNLMVKLKEKEEQLQEKNQANQELLAELEKARAVQAIPGTGKLKAELAIAHTTVGALQKAFWKSFPSPHHYYHIKAPSGNGGYAYLCADYFGFLCSSPSDGLKGHFKFEKDPDGTFAIYSMAKAKYLQIQPSSGTSALSVMFCANAENKSKVSLIFHDHPDKQLPGILVDIFSLENGCFLSPSAILQNQFAANLVKAPANKFLIVAAEVGWNDVKMESEDL